VKGSEGGWRGLNVKQKKGPPVKSSQGPRAETHRKRARRRIIIRGLNREKGVK